MQLRKNKHNVALMRAKYIPVEKLAASDGRTIKTGGGTERYKVATISRYDPEIPPDVIALLTLEEIELVTREVIEPAQLMVVERAARIKDELAEQAALLTDPNRVLEHVFHALAEAIDLTGLARRLPSVELISRVFMRCTELALLCAVNGPDCGAGTAEVLLIVAQAMSQVTRHIGSAVLPAAVGEVTKENAISRAWAEIGKGSAELRAAMQAKKFVKVRASK